MYTHYTDDARESFATTPGAGGEKGPSCNHKTGGVPNAKLNADGFPAASDTRPTGGDAERT
jgi:hypothetical protein